MIDNKRLLAVIITLSLAGVLTLFFLSTTIEAEEMAIAEITDEHIGMLVTVNATIQQIYIFDDSVAITLSDLRNNTITIFMYAEVWDDWLEKTSALPGAKLSAEGFVEFYDGAPEIAVSKADNLRITAPPDSNFVRISQLLAAPDIFDGMTVRTNGTMKNIEIIPQGMRFSLRFVDHSAYELECIVVADNIEGAWLEGDEISAVGTFAYNQNTGRWQLEIPGESGITRPGLRAL